MKIRSRYDKIKLKILEMHSVHKAFKLTNNKEGKNPKNNDACVSNFESMPHTY